MADSLEGVVGLLLDLSGVDSIADVPAVLTAG